MLVPTLLRLQRRPPESFIAFYFLMFAGLCLVPNAPLRAQNLQPGTFDATILRQPENLGVVWLVKGGDDPAYARADYDDSQWMRVDTHRLLRDYFPGTDPSDAVAGGHHAPALRAHCAAADA